MSRNLCCIPLMLLLAATVLAQEPIQRASFVPSSKLPPLSRPELPGMTLSAKKPAPPAAIPHAIVEQRRRFDPQAIEVKRDGSRWQLWSGAQLLKDFGEQRADADLARRLVADLKLNEHGTIGTPGPVMEYWLSDGAAPYPPSFARDIIPLDPETLRVVQQDYTYYVRDARQILYNFGPYESDAKLALAVMQRYGFNEIGFIGLPRPTMTYLIKSSRPRVGPGQAADPLKPRLLPQQLARLPLTLPKLGTVGERSPIDPMRVDLQKGQDGWHLVSGSRDLGSVGISEHFARQSLQMLQRYPLNEYVRIGTSGFGFYLSRGLAPRGVPVGVRHTSFDTKALAAKQVGEQWVVTDGRHTVATFSGNQESDAKLAVKVLQYYGFDAQCDVGPGLHFLAKER